MKSCGCCDSKGGAIFVAAFETVVYGIYLVLIWAFGLHFESVGDGSKLRFDVHDDQLASIHFFVSFSIILAYLLTAVALCVGIFKESGFLLKIWMISRVLLLIIYLLVSMVFWFLYHNHQVSLPKHRMVALILSFFFLFVIYSHYTHVTDPLSPQIYRYRMEPTQSQLELQQLTQSRLNLHNSYSHLHSHSYSYAYSYHHHQPMPSPTNHLAMGPGQINVPYWALR